MILLATGDTPDDGALIMDGGLHPDDLLEQDSTLIEQLGVSLSFLHVSTPYTKDGLYGRVRAIIQTLAVVFLYHLNPVTGVLWPLTGVPDCD